MKILQIRHTPTCIVSFLLGSCSNPVKELQTGHRKASLNEELPCLGHRKIECSDHYACAMASYGVFAAATGFHCHASSGLLRFEQKIGTIDFTGPFIGAGAWGHFSQKLGITGLATTLDLRFGSIRIDRLEPTSSDGKAAASPVMLAGIPLPHRIESRAGGFAIVLEKSLTPSPGQILKVAA